MSGEPLPDLTTLASLLEPKKFRGLIRKAHQLAWAEYGQGPLVNRFDQRGFPNSLGFAKRSWRYQQRYIRASAKQRYAHKYKGGPVPYVERKGPGQQKRDGVPHFVFTGQAKDSVLRRKPKTKFDELSVTTKRSIHFRALNAIAGLRGKLVETQITERREVYRRAHVRRTKDGRSIAVRGYRQMTGKTIFKSTPAMRTYGEEWAFRPGEVVAVSRRSDELLRDALRTIGFNKKTGTLKARFRSRLAAQEAEFNAAMFDVGDD